jgi:hypothetical protein
VHWIIDVVVAGCFLFAGFAFITVAASIPEKLSYFLKSGFVSLVVGVAIAWFFLYLATMPRRRHRL